VNRWSELYKRHFIGASVTFTLVEARLSVAADQDLGARLAAARQRVGLSQAEAARELGVSKVTVSNWERGVHPPDERRMAGIAALYQTTPAALRYGEAAESSASALGTPRVAAGLPYKIRVWLQEELLDYARAGVPDDELQRARRLLESEELFSFYAGGEPQAYGEDAVLEGMQGVALAIRRSLRVRGYKVDAR
jgi:transcriptional regulator with XRE-family HTH domain